MSNAVLDFSIQYKVDVEQKYLFVEDAQIECDSVHALFERILKIEDKNLHVPYEFVKYKKEARESFPYDSECVTLEFFLDHSKVNYYYSIRSGRVTGDPVVIGIRCLSYQPSGSGFFKLSFNHEYE